MGVDGCVSGGSCEIFSFSVRNVLSISLDVSLCQTEVQNENFMASLVQTDAEVIWLYVSVDKMTVVDVFDSLDHLVDEYQDGLK